MRSRPSGIAPFVRQALAIACVWSLGSALAVADVKILGAGGQTYPSIQVAVDAAAPGDTLVLGEDSYGGFVIDGKGLTLISPGVTPQTIDGTLRIQNLPAGQVVSLDNLRIQGRLWDGDWENVRNEDALELFQNSGAVRLYNCELLGGSGPHDEYNPGGYAAGGRGAWVEDSTDVAFLGCQLVGGDGAGNPSNEYEGDGGAGGAGLKCNGSAVALYDCHLQGGDGGSAGLSGGDGAHGADVVNLGLFSSGSVFEGGDGGDALDFIIAYPGDGGSGLSVELGAQARLLDNSYGAGTGGYSIFGSGTDGVPKFWAGGQLDEVPGMSRSLSVARSFVADGESFQLQVNGEPGDRVFLAVGTRPAFQFVGNPPGVRLVPFPQFTDWGATTVIGPSGQATLQLPSFERPSGGWKTVIAQLRAIPAGGGAAIGGAVLLTNLDDEGGADCNGNGRLDLFDVLEGVEADCNGDFLPDACTFTGDCNNNGIDDLLDVQCSGVADANGNLIPDICEAPTTLYVDATAPAGGDGSAAAPFNNLAQAVQGTLDGWSIEVAGGLYTGPANRNLNLGTRSLSFSCPGGSSAGIIDLQQSGFALGSEGSGATVQVTGFTFQNGLADNEESGAIWSTGDVHLILRDCRFVDCSSNWGAGAIAGIGELEIEECEFTGNRSPGGFGGAIGFVGPMRLTRSHFEGNLSARGGAIYNGFGAGESARTEISHSTFTTNYAGGFGGAVYLSAGPHFIDHCLFDANAINSGSGFGERGGAVFHAAWTGGPIGRLTITHSTFVRNGSPDTTGTYSGGGAVHVGNHARLTLLNSILWDNPSSFGSSLRLEGASAFPSLIEIGFCDLQHGLAAIPVVHGSVLSDAVLDVDPLFLDPGVRDYRLGAGSACIDAGNDGYLADDFNDQDGDGSLTEPVPVDLAGNPRQVDDPAVADTGVGAAPLADMGVFERQ